MNSDEGMTFEVKPVFKPKLYNALTLAELWPTPTGQDVDEGRHIYPWGMLTCLKENLQEQQKTKNMSHK